MNVYKNILLVEDNAKDTVLMTLLSAPVKFFYVCINLFCLIPFLPFGGNAQMLSNDSLSTPLLKLRSLEELMDIDITIVSKKAERWLEAPASVYAITDLHINRSGASSIPQALRLANNLQVGQKGSSGWGITARGFNTELANKLLVLIDGRTVYTPLYSGVFWDRQDYLLKDIDRIEVISGPGGTLWGANAVNGVINIVTKDASQTQGLYAEAGGGTTLRNFAAVRYGDELTSDIYFRVYGKYFDRTSEILANGSDALDSWSMGQGGFRIDTKYSSENNFTFQGDVYSSDANVIFGKVAKTRGGNILGRWSHTFSEASDMKFQVYYDRTELSLPTDTFFVGTTNVAPPGILKDNLDTYDADFQHRFSLDGRNSIVWGLGYRFTHDVVGNSPALGFFPATLDQQLFSAFVQDEITVASSIVFTIGTKIELNDYTGFEFEPSARVKWKLSEEQILWGAISRAVRSPSRVDRDESLPTPPYYLFPEPFPPMVLLIGGKNFKSETVLAYELGYRAQLTASTVTSVSVFYNIYDHIRSTDTTAGTMFSGTLLPFPFPLYFANNLEAETYGVEFNVTHQVFSWWRLQWAYNFLNEHVRVKPGKYDFNNAKNETADPEHQVTLHSSTDLLENIAFDTGIRWVDVLHNNSATTIGSVPSYFEVDVRIGWRPLENIEVSIAGQNLLHDHHPEFGFPIPTRTEIKRSVYGKISFSL